MSSTATIPPITKSFNAISFTLGLSSNHGNVVLSATATGPLPMNTFAAVYKAAPPAGNANDSSAMAGWFFIGPNQYGASYSSSKEFSNLNWGTNYWAAVSVLENQGKSNQYGYACQIGPTQS